MFPCDFAAALLALQNGLAVFPSVKKVGWGGFGVWRVS